jgi:hypothetical protein
LCNADVIREAAEHSCEDLVVVLEVSVHEIRDGVAAPIAAVMAAVHGEQGQLLRIFYREEAKKDLVEQGEDGGVGAYTEGKGEDGNGGEARAAAEGAKGILEVAGRGFEPAEEVHGSSAPCAKVFVVETKAGREKFGEIPQLLSN